MAKKKRKRKAGAFAKRVGALIRKGHSFREAVRLARGGRKRRRKAERKSRRRAKSLRRSRSSALPWLG